MHAFEQTWQQLLTNLKPKVNEFNYNNWFQQLSFVDVDDHTVILGAPNTFVKDWILDYYHDLITQELYQLTEKSYSLDFKIIPGNATAAAGSDEITLPVEPVERVEPQQRAEPPKNLNPKYTFERFVVGSSNQFVHAATMSAAELPGGHYNPLFIYGGVGLGKTHLMHALGNKISELFPGQRILYLSAEQFMNELIFSIRFEKMDNFRKKFREGCDVLLVDDIQFIVGKERTQEEFFHTFNALYENQRQIAFISPSPLMCPQHFPSAFLANILAGIPDKLQNLLESQTHIQELYV